ncbi:MmgE/PrpD family protein [Rhizobium sp. BK251]|uniref:MmgE/PrpD family protein n=1 Tax=Rhizobium sp. BK251 TaxID=2512125 RepID=UPI0010E3055A|nr:MmgE/PrpD family protein [Rhizobium sp. BK251]TCL63643.1 2-methylcitrate dehydratase PrpD [Rhizobium sp. BK251]
MSAKSIHLVRILSDHVAAADAMGFPPDVKEISGRAILDLLAATIAGVDTPSALATRRAAPGLFGSGQSPVWLTSRSLSAAAALFCNSAAACALDLDDGNRAARGHPGSCVIPTVLTLATPETRADDLIASIVVGYDVGVRIAAAQNPDRIKSRQSGRWAPYAAVAAAGRLLRRTPDEISRAFSIAGVLAPNQEANGSSGYSALTGNDVKEGIAWSSLLGLSALHLAMAGQKGPMDILDHASHYDGSRIVNRLGDHWEIVDTYFKPYGCCRYIHAALDALLEIMEREKLVHEDLRSIEVETFEWATRLANRLDPANIVDVQYSLPYCLAVAAADGRSALCPVTGSVLARTDLADLASRVAIRIDLDLDRAFPGQTGARVIVSSSKGRFVRDGSSPLGDPARPMSWQMLVDKFRMATGGRISFEKQSAIIDAVLATGQGEASGLLKELRSRR